MAQTPIKYNRFIIIAVIAFVVTGLIIIALDRQQIVSIVGKANWVFAGIAAITTGGSYFFECYSYIVLNRLFNINPGYGKLFSIGFTSIAIGNVVSTPFGVTDHSIRGLLLIPRGFKSGDVIAASIFHSYIKDVAILVLAPGVMIYQLLTENLSPAASRILIIVAILTAALLAVFSLLFLSRVIRGYILRALFKVWRLIARRNPQNIMGDFDNAVDETKTKLKEHPALGFILLGSMFADWIFALGSLELCFMAFGLTAPFTSVTSGYIVGKTAAIISLIPGGIGIQTLSTAGTYALLGIPFSIAILVDVLFRVIYQYIPYVISLFLFRYLLKSVSLRS
jgi:uncharacterized protein (TIRG00374 family)